MTDTLTKSLRKGQACANEQIPHLEYLSALAQVNPQIKPAVDELMAQADTLQSICEVGLMMAKNQPTPTPSA